MLLTEVLSELPGAHLEGDGDVAIDAVVYDSRKISPGSIFVAIPGQHSDGHSFLGQAQWAGASALAVQADHTESAAPVLRAQTLPYLVVPDTRAALARIAAALHHYPARELWMIGVTGTDGKTTVCHLVDHILAGAGQPAGLITTAECRVGGQALMDTGRFTTPEAPELQAMLRRVADAGYRWAVVEATSHGLALNRLDCCEFDIAASTVITSDHLEFHGTVQEYVRAKSRLFSMLDDSVDKGVRKTAVVNADDPWSIELRRASRANVNSYGIENTADVTAAAIKSQAWSTRFEMQTPVGAVEVSLDRPGLFLVSAALAATAICLAAGVDLGEIAAGIRSWPGAPGRMQCVEEGQPFKVVVDFAHAPQSLERVLGVLRASSRGRIIAVFGCVGERERDRRAAMGEVAARMADYTIVTDDNPYSEDRDVILRQIVSGLEGAGRRRGHDFEVVPDRRKAIAQALAMAVDEDVVLLAGKGHETEVHLGNDSYPCDDRAVAAAELRRLVGSTAS
jgi:UDP-N-acetylmuramoyl-L-alanyl-D-glutamate--2,6-diaminopimelate ligase